MSEDVSITECVYFGKWKFDRGISSCVENVSFIEESKRLGDHRSWISHGQPFPGCSDRPTKFTFRLTYGRPSENDLKRLRRLTSRALPIPFCMFKRLSEPFTQQAITHATQRYDVLTMVTDPDQLPPEASTRFVGNIILDSDDSETPITWGTTYSDPDIYRQEFTTGLAVGTKFDADYVPLFLVRPMARERILNLVAHEPWDILLEEY